MSEWIEIKYHEATEKDKQLYGDECKFVWDCPLPNNMEEVLITDQCGELGIAEFCIGEGSYFWPYDDIDDVVAWMPLPEPFEREEDED